MWNRVKKLDIPYMVLAVFMAVLLWFYVDLTVKPDTRVSIRGIEVEYLGENYLEQQGLMLAEGKPHTLSLTLTGPRSVVSQLNRGNITVSVDLLTQVREAGRQKLDYTITFPSSINLSSVKISRSVNSIEAEIVRYSTKTIRVETRFSGSVAPGYLGGEEDFTVSPKEITIHGEDQLVKSVSHAVVELNEMSLSTSWEGDMTVMLVGNNGQLMDANSLELSSPIVHGVFPVQCYKDVPLKVDLVPGGGVRVEDVNSLKLSPSTIRVIGTEEKLEELDSISLGEIHLADVVTTLEETRSIQLPRGVTHADNTTEAVVSFSLSSSLSTKTVETENIVLKKIPEGRTAQLTQKSVKVDIRGPRESMKLLRPEYVTVEADLSGVTEDQAGEEISLPAKVTVKGMSDVGVMGSYTVAVVLE